MEKLVIIGTGTGAENVYNFVRYYNLFDIIGFAVDRKYIHENKYIGLPVFPIEELQRIIDVKSTKIFVGLFWNHLNADRKSLFERLNKQGFQFANIISPSARVRGNISGKNVWVNDYAVIETGALIEDNVLIRGMSLIGEHTHIMRHVFLGAKSTIGGNVIIGEQSFVGLNCTVFDDTIIGKKCILGACTIIKRNIPDCSICKTNSDLSICQYDEPLIEKKLDFRKNVR